MKKFITCALIALFLIFGISFAKANYGQRPSAQEQIDILHAQQIDNYFRAKKMPLVGYGSKMIEISDKYNLDWRLLPAISVRETSGGLHMCKGNPFGWGSCKIGFKTVNESIEIVGNRLGTLPIYKDKTTYKKLYYYNGTVVKAYPNEVIKIMDSIGTLN